MRRVEIEAFVKSFFLFFLSLSSLIGFIFYGSYQNSLKDFNQMLFSKMKMASMGDKNSDFKIVKEPIKKSLKPTKLYKDSNYYYIYFKSKDSRVYNKVLYSKDKFSKEKKRIFNEVLIKFLQTLLAILLISVLFSLYLLRPYRKYIGLTNEFIRDILHDFNTPLSIIRLNVNLLKDREKNKNIERIEGGVNTILHLQQNLREYLEGNTKEATKFDLQELVQDRVNYVRSIYPHITFKVDIPNLKLFCYKDGFVRVLDNILDNACKYNKKDGSVEIFCKDKRLYIKDSGLGIKEPKRVFDRFYKESQRGLGIGLHIVKKLTDKMNIAIKVESKVGEGSLFILDLKEILA